jgi:RecA-family ATPase
MISMVRVEDHQGCKDAADLIAAHGADAVRQAIAQAVPWNKPEVVEESASAELTVVTAANLVATHSDYRKPLIEGLLREGETMNIIAAPKVGKSWLVLLLAFSVANGLSFLGRKCAQGSVPIIDNELHPETAAQRLRSVADALGVGLENVHLVSLRGQLEDLPTLRSRIERAALKVGARLIVLDALYRLLPVGASENDNAGMMQLYNEIDGIARESGASIIAIHHPEKRSCPLPVGVIDRW